MVVLGAHTDTHLQSVPAPMLTGVAEQRAATAGLAAKAVDKLWACIGGRRRMRALACLVAFVTINQLRTSGRN